MTLAIQVSGGDDGMTTLPGETGAGGAPGSTDDGGPPAVDVRGLVKTYSGVRAVNGIDLGGAKASQAPTSQQGSSQSQPDACQRCSYPRSWGSSAARP